MSLVGREKAGLVESWLLGAQAAEDRFGGAGKVFDFPGGLA